MVEAGWSGKRQQMCGLTGLLYGLCWLHGPAASMFGLLLRMGVQCPAALKAFDGASATTHQ